MLDKFWHFIIVGAFGFGIDVSVTHSTWKGWQWHKYLSNSTGFLSGVTFNYYFNRTWTFASDDPQILMQYLKFAIIGIVGLGIVNGMVYLLHSRKGMPFYPAKIAAMFVFMFWNFSANYFYTFG